MIHKLLLLEPEDRAFSLSGVSVIAIFFGLILIAELSGKWNSSLSYSELRSLLSDIANLTHP